MSFEVVATRLAVRQIAGLRGARRDAYEAFEWELANTGCRAMGYRLTGEDPLPSLCVKHLRGTDRAVVAFVENRAYVLLVGPHSAGDRASDVYTRLYEMLGMVAPSGQRTKPSCCDASGEPPLIVEITVDAFHTRI